MSKLKTFFYTLMYFVAQCNYSFAENIDRSKIKKDIIEICGQNTSSSTNGILNSIEKCYVTETHNYFRKKKQLPEITFDSNLSETMYKWFSTEKKFAHSSNSFRNGAGENIYASIGSSACASDVLIEQVIAWYSEINNYNESSNKCDSGKVCGHYTQVMWKKSTKVGCAHYFISGKKMCLAGCEYSPAGNFTGQRPY